VAEFLAHTYNQIESQAKGDIIYLREDDVIATREQTRAMFMKLTEGETLVAAVGCPYANRHIEGKNVAGWYDQTIPHWKQRFYETKKQERVDFSGTGCVMYWKKSSPGYGAFVDGIPAHDWNWGLELKKRGGQLILLPDQVKHYQTEAEWI